jgi:DNA topoisomerase-2
VLTYRDDDGDSVEPFHFVPILPLVLCNGTEGIGTGFSTSVPTFHPLHIVYNLRRMLAGAEPEPMTPWAWGFKGTVSLDPANGYRVLTEGVSAVLDDGETVEITELPWGVWNANYKAFLCSLLDPKVVGASAAAADSTSPASAAAAAGFTIRGFSEHHTEDAVCFRVSLSPEAMAHVAAVGVSDAFRLTSSFLTSNMHLFDEHDKISLLDSAEDVMLAYFPVRLTLYAKRREHQLRVLQAQADRAGDRMRFIELVISGDLVLSKRKKADIVADLRRLGIRPVPKDAAKRGTGAGAADADAEADEVPIPDLPAVKGAAATATPATTATAVVAGVSSDYDYLLSMPLGSLTAERVSALAAEIASLRAQIADLTASTPATLWSRELDELERAFTQQMRMPSYEEYLLVQHQLPTPVLGKSIKGRGGVAAKAAAAAKTKTAKKTTKK